MQIHLKTGAIESHISKWFRHSFKNMPAGSPVVKKGSDIFIVNSIYSVECESKTQQGLRNYNTGNISHKDKWLKSMVEKIYCDSWRGESCGNSLSKTKKTERSWLWSPTCWRVSIQPDERNSWQNMGSQAEAKVSSGGISRPLLQKKGKAGGREEAQNSQHLWKACKMSADKNLYELKTGSSSSEINSKVVSYNKMSGNTDTWQQQKDVTVKWWQTRALRDTP